MRENFMFSNGQDLGSLASSGVVCTNPFDLELDTLAGNTIIENDQIEAWFCVKILTCTQASGDSGLDIELRENDNADMTTGTPRYLGIIRLIEAELVAGNVYSIKVHKQLSMSFLGAWYKAVNESLDGATTIDCWMHTGPMSPNDSIQKVPSR